MKIPNPLTYLLRKSSIQVGEQMKLEFKMPKIESEIYGCVDDLSGEIPLLLNRGDHPRSEFYYMNEAEQDQIVKQFYGFILSVDENLSDEKLYTRALYYILAALAYMPWLEPKTPTFNHMVKIIGACFMGDDGIDSIEFMESLNHQSALGKVSHGVERGQNGDLDAFSKIGLTFPPLQPAIKEMVSFVEYEESLQPNARYKYHYVLGEFYDIMYSQCILFAKTNYSKVLNGNTWILVNGVNKGIGLPLECYSAIKNLKIPRVIRESLVFKEMKNCFYSINSGVNDIRGIVRDIRKGKVSDSTILSKVRDDKNVNLKTAFNLTLASVQESYQKISLFMELLEATYSDNQDLIEYVEIVKVMLDGQLYAYFGFEECLSADRYGTGGEYIVTTA